MSNSVIQGIEENIKQAKAVVDVGNALRRLKNHPDFKTVISTGYFEREAVRLVLLKADAHVQSPEVQQAILAQIDAIGALNQYFNTLLYKADMAGKSIEADQTAIEEIAAEDLANG